MPQSFQVPLKLVGDSYVAERLNIARATVRVQRHLRRSGKPHWLDLNPILVGSRPKYFLHDVDSLMERLLKAESVKVEGRS